MKGQVRASEGKCPLLERSWSPRGVINKKNKKSLLEGMTTRSQMANRFQLDFFIFNYLKAFYKPGTIVGMRTTCK